MSINKIERIKILIYTKYPKIMNYNTNNELWDDYDRFNFIPQSISSIHSSQDILDQITKLIYGHEGWSSFNKGNVKVFFSTKRSFFPKKCIVFSSFLLQECTCRCVWMCASGYSFTTTSRTAKRAVEKGLSSSRQPKRAEKRQLFRKHTLSLPSSSRRFTRRGERWCIAAW